MDKFKKHAVKIGALIIGFIIYGFIVKSIAKADGTGGNALLMVIGGWVLFIFFLVKFIAAIFKAPAKAGQAVAAAPASFQSSDDLKDKAGKNSRLVIYFVFFIFVGLLATSTNRPANFTNPFTISNAFGGWFWGIIVLCFIVGLGGKRITTTITGRTMSGTPVTGYLDHGAVKGTDGLPGAVALTLSFISVYMVWAMIAHWKFKTALIGTKNTNLVIIIIVSAFAIIPLYMVLVKMIRSNNKVNWIIGGAWLVFLTIVARL